MAGTERGARWLKVRDRSAKSTTFVFYFRRARLGDRGAKINWFTKENDSRAHLNRFL